MCNPLSLFPQAQITMKVIQGLYSGVTTVELDTLAAETAATLTTKHPDYALLAARIAVSNLHKETKKVFSGEYKYRNILPCCKLTSVFFFLYVMHIFINMTLH